MNLFEYFFTNKAYLPADLPGRLFSPLHIAVMIILTVAVPLVAFLLRKMDKKKMKILFIVLWAVMVVAEGAKITDTDDANDTEQPDKNKDGENKKAAPHGVRKNGRHRQNGGRKNASGKLPKMPAENNGN